MKRLLIPLLLSLSGCAATPPPAEQHHVTGQLYHADGKVRVFIDGELAADGWLPMTEDFDAGFLYGGAERDYFPLLGEFRGRPVEVNCGPMPVIMQPYCRVEIDGVQAALLRFDQQGNSYPEDA